MIPSDRKIPAWLLGLIIALIVSGAVLILMMALGIGDDPVVEGLGPPQLSLLGI